MLQVGSNDNMTQYTIQETRSMLFLADNTTTDVNGSVIGIPDTYYWNFSAPSAPSFGARSIFPLYIQKIRNPNFLFVLFDRIMPWNSSQCITLSRGDQGGLNGTAILIQDCSGKPNQEWLFQKSNSSDLD